ncbi:hypothetical protein NA78x_002296 [Anatilimnocola sp. NA78]
MTEQLDAGGGMIVGEMFTQLANQWLSNGYRARGDFGLKVIGFGARTDWL